MGLCLQVQDDNESNHLKNVTLYSSNPFQVDLQDQIMKCTSLSKCLKPIFFIGISTMSSLAFNKKLQTVSVALLLTIMQQYSKLSISQSDIHTFKHIEHFLPWLTVLSTQMRLFRACKGPSLNVCNTFIPAVSLSARSENDNTIMIDNLMFSASASSLTLLRTSSPDLLRQCSFVISRQRYQTHRDR